MLKSISTTKKSTLDAVDMLKTDHRNVEELFKMFKSARTKRERVRLANSIIKELSIHATVEEKLVYPLLKSEFEDQTDEAMEEHHVVKFVLAELADLDGSEENLNAKVKLLNEMVKHHVKEEEENLLPKLKKMKVDMQELGMKIEREKSKLTSNMKKTADKSKRQIGGAPAKRRAS